MHLLNSSQSNAMLPLQTQTTKALAYALWVHVPIVLGLGLYIGSANLIPALVLTAALAAAATVSVQMSPRSSATRCTVASSYMMQAAALVFLCGGHPWQIDMHMYFFAALAISVATFDAKAVIAAAAVTAVHHLVLNIIAPAWVFPGGADFARVVLHAVIVVVQTAVLLTLILKLHEAIETASEKSAEALQVQDLLREEDVQRQAMVDQLAQALSGLADGNLTTRLNAQFAEGYDKLRLDFNSSLKTLEALIIDVVEQISGIRGTIGEIEQAAGTLSNRTENQAASLEETAAALDEITETVENTAAGTKQANELVSATQKRAQKSEEVVKDTVLAMSEIEKSSDKIADVVSVIDEIAFQTNLLALNAGVEAARAGNAGKGFAVVASEVRTLAQRSSEAAREIKDIISTSRSQVGHGVELVGRAGGEIEEIIEQVKSFSTLVSDITSATQEQATTLSEVNSAVNQMSQMTQHNAAMAEESTAASHVLSGAVNQLTDIVRRFKTDTYQPGYRAGQGEIPVRRSA